MINGTSVRVHHSAAALKKPPGTLARKKWEGLTTKIHALTDHDDTPVKLVIARSQIHGIQATAELLKDILKGRMMLADGAYGADWLREMVVEKGGWANIPAKTNRKALICWSHWL